ncbi:DNA repair protein RecO [Rheinheimera sp. 4Y26]|uniref:DNA repair protein RecO n=1 Tax=Rheinheimera sp. 4Y26 TaxID=2977811 RepID=UPI0021B1177E|nr:DNA repair protein RecO C-terminal domain-containing protein [Rheinheimera sp. 4Y26]MCT6698990.1 DNA repair protein RecO C-terminal domain-containing protein [Rheinheimera sp. 4Y26]
MTTGFSPAYLLHSRAFRDDKLLLDLLLPEQGRLRAVARRPGKKQGGRSNWPAFALLAVQLTGRGELKTVRALEEQQPALQFQGDFLFSAMYINELLCRIWPQDVASEHLFALYQQSLLDLAAAQPHPGLLQPVLRRFELMLLAELGVPVDFAFDAQQQPLAVDGLYQWQAEVGLVRTGFIDANGRQHGVGWPGDALMAIERGQWHDKAQRVAKQLCRYLLQPLLGNQPLASRALFNR